VYTCAYCIQDCRSALSSNALMFMRLILKVVLDKIYRVLLATSLMVYKFVVKL